jgi:hypothetical protein
MSHNHHHDHNCGDHAHGHDHTDIGGPSDNMFMHIDRDNVIALNSIGEGKQVIKPWNERLDEQVVSICQSEMKKRDNEHAITLTLTRYSISSRMQTSSCGSPVQRVASLALPVELTIRGSIIRVPFTGSVKLRSLLLKSGPGEQTPAKVALVCYFTRFRPGRGQWCSLWSLMPRSSSQTSITLTFLTFKTRNLCNSSMSR